MMRFHLPTLLLSLALCCIATSGFGADELQPPLANSNSLPSDAVLQSWIASQELVEDWRITAEPLPMAPEASAGLGARVLYFMGSEELLGERYEAAAAYFTQAMEAEPENPSIRLGLALAMLERSQPEAALELAEGVLASNPKEVLALRYKALGLLGVGRRPEALAALEEARALAPRNTEILESLGEQYRLVADVDKMIEIYTNLVSIDQGNLRALFFLSWAHLHRGNVDEALRYIDDAVDRYPRNGQLHARKLEMIRQARRPELLRPAIRQAIVEAGDPTDFEAELVQLVEREGKRNGLIDEYREFAKQYPHETRVRLRLASMLVERNALADAILEYERVLAEQPDNPEAHFALGNLYVRLDRFDEAMASFKASQRSGPFDAKRYFEVGLLYNRKGEFARAAENFKQGLAIDPSSVELSVALGGALREDGRLDESVDALNSALKEIGPHAMLYDQLALTFKRQGMGALTEENLERSTQLDGTNARVRLALYHAQLENKNEAGAEASLEIILSRFLSAEEAARDPSYLTQLVNVAVQNGRADHAIRVLDTLLGQGEGGLLLAGGVFASLAPRLTDIGMGAEAADFRVRLLDKVPDAQRDRWDGELAQALGERERALAAYRRALEREPRNAVLHSRQLNILAAMGERAQMDAAYGRAESVLQGDSAGAIALDYAMLLVKADERVEARDFLIEKVIPLKLSPSLSATAQRTLGDLQAALGQPEEAERAYRIALELAPNDVLSLNNFGYFLANRGERLDEAETMVKRALSLNPEAGFILDSLGWIYYQKGEIDQAIRYLELAVAREGSNPELHEHLADAYQRANRLGDALRHWRRAIELDPGSQVRLQARIDSLTAAPSANPSGADGIAGAGAKAQ